MMRTNVGSRNVPMTGESVALAVGVAGLTLFLLAAAALVLQASPAHPDAVPFGARAPAPDPAAPVPAPAKDTGERGPLARDLVKSARLGLRAAEAFLDAHDPAASPDAEHVSELLGLVLAAGGR